MCFRLFIPKMATKNMDFYFLILQLRSSTTYASQLISKAHVKTHGH